jgi:hypothetical protein
LRIDPSSAEHFSWSDWKALGDTGLSYPKYVAMRVKKSLRRSPSSIYCRQAFNDHGDVVAHHDQPSTWQPARHAEHWHLNERHLDGAIQRVNHFQDRCRQRQITVIVELPPLAEAAYRENAVVVERIRAELRHKCRAPIVNPEAVPSRPNDQFFDTHYHLSARGKALRTTALAETLKPLLNDPQAVMLSGLPSAEVR